MLLLGDLGGAEGMKEKDKEDRVAIMSLHPFFRMQS